MITPYTLAKVRLFKAILPIMIVLHHFAFFYGTPPFFAKLGLPIVACFFLMSGYGLMASYLNKGEKYFEGFIWHISNKLLIPYLLAVIVYIPFVLIIRAESIVKYITETNFIDWLRFSWFVWVLLGGYLLFYLVFKTKMTNFCKLSLYGSISLLYYIVSMCVLEGKLPCLFRTSYAIFLGMLWKYNEEKIIHILNLKYVMLFATFLSIICLVISVKTENLLLNPLFSVITFICIAYLIPLNKDYKIVKSLSKISYEFYLWQGLSIVVVCDYFHLTKMYIAIPLCLCLNALFSIIAHYLNNKIICLNLVHQKV